MRLDMVLLENKEICEVFCDWMFGVLENKGLTGDFIVFVLYIVGKNFLLSRKWLYENYGLRKGCLS